MEHKESEEQRTVVDYCRTRKILCFSIPNDTNFSGNAMQRARQMNNLKATGFLNGASDLVIMLNNVILFIEMKKQRTRKLNGDYKALSSDGISISEFQTKFLDEVNEFDYACAKVCFGAKEAIEFIEKHE